MLTRWYPSREMKLMRRMLERSLSDDWQPIAEDAESTDNMLAVDVDEDDDSFTVTTSLPSVQAENINVNVDGNLLTIAAEVPQTVTRDTAGARVLMREQRYGRFSRTIRLPQPIKSDAADAHFDDGVLRLHLPKAEEAKGRSIPVKFAS